MSAARPVFQRIIQGADVKDYVEFGAKNRLCETYSFLRNGHELCGDSLFVHMEHNRVFVGVFDGVGSENGVKASPVVAQALLEALIEQDGMSYDNLNRAYGYAFDKSRIGLTTTAVACFDENGRYFLTSVGDSPIYLRQNAQVRMMINLDRYYDFLGMHIETYKAKREAISQALGGRRCARFNFQSGIIRSGSVFMLCSDGISDNLAVPYKPDCDGKFCVASEDDVSDLARIIRRFKKPKSIVTRLIETVDERVGTKEEYLWLGSEKVVIPKPDDIALIALRWL